MSHQPERKEKDCLNCGAELRGRFCHICGQENTNPHQSFWSLVTHFIYDIFHFDGKFFNTLGLLLFRPGYVAQEYVKGKRVRFLDPIRMYLFTSAVFFLVFFSVEALNLDVTPGSSWTLSKAERMELAMNLSEEMKNNPEDSISKMRLASLLDSTRKIEMELSPDKDSSNIHFRGKDYRMQVSTDTLLVPKTTSGNWLLRKFTEQTTKFEKRYKDNPAGGASAFINSFLHRLPYLLFLSLPVFAGILKLLYTRRKRFFYSDHATFTLYHYIFSFILLLFAISFDALHERNGWGFLPIAITVLYIALPVHLLIAMKRFYAQGWAKTLFKFLILNLLGFLVLLLLFFVFLLLSLSQM